MASDEDKSGDRMEALEETIRGQVTEAFRTHVDDLHVLTPAEIGEKLDEHNNMIESMDRIVNRLEGEPETDLQGNVIGRVGGMAQTQDTMAERIDVIYQRTNGGVSVTNTIKPDWTRGQKIAAYGLGISILFAALPGVVGVVRWLAELWVT